MSTSIASSSSFIDDKCPVGHNFGDYAMVVIFAFVVLAIIQPHGWPFGWVPLLGRSMACALGAAMTAIFSDVTASEAFQSVNVDVLALLFGMMLLSKMVEATHMADSLRGLLTKGNPSANGLLFRASLLAFFISMLVTNDGAVVFVAPLVHSIAIKDRKYYPVWLQLIAVATAANIGSAALLTGNPQNIIVRGYSSNVLSFTEYMYVTSIPTVMALLINYLLLVIAQKLLHTADHISTRKRTRHSSVDSGRISREPTNFSVIGGGIQSMKGDSIDEEITPEEDVLVVIDGIDDEQQKLLLHVDGDNHMTASRSTTFFADEDMKVLEAQGTEKVLRRDSRPSNAQEEDDMLYNVSVTRSGDQLSHGEGELSQRLLVGGEFDKSHSDSNQSHNSLNELLQDAVPLNKSEGHDRKYLSESGGRVTSRAPSNAMSTSESFTSTDPRKVRTVVLYHRKTKDLDPLNTRYRYFYILLSLVIFVMVGMFVATDINSSWLALFFGVGMTVVYVFMFDRPAQELWALVDGDVFIIFPALFVTANGLLSTCYTQYLWKQASSPDGFDPNDPYGLIVFVVTVILLSNTIGNVPTVVLMRPAVMNSMGDKKLSWILLAWVSTLAGNLTLMGSAANILVAESVKPNEPRERHMTFSRHLRIGVLSTLLTIAVGVPMIVYLA